MQIETVGGEFRISDVLLQAWMTRYPAADLRREYPLMVLWITKNPAKKPKNAIRFIENWLKRVQQDSIRNLAETSKRGRETAERVGNQYGVTARPGETQEDYNRRVVAACAGSIGHIKSVA